MFAQPDGCGVHQYASNAREPYGISQFDMKKASVTIELKAAHGTRATSCNTNPFETSICFSRTSKLRLSRDVCCSAPITDDTLEDEGLGASISQDNKTSNLYAEAEVQPRAARALATISTFPITKRSAESPLRKVRMQVAVLST